MRVVFLVMVSAICPFSTIAQLPYFSTQVGESTYLDESGKTKSFRALEHFEAEIVPVRAHLAASRCLRRVDTLAVLVTKLQLKGSLATEEALALRELLRRAQFGDHDLLAKLSTNSRPGDHRSIALYHSPLLSGEENASLTLSNAGQATLNKEERTRFATYQISSVAHSPRLVTSRDTTAAIQLAEAEIATLISAAQEYADLNQRAASYFLGIHMFLGEACRKGPLPVRSLKESAFFFHGRGGPNALSSASFALSNAAKPSASVQLVSMALPVSNLTVSSTASTRRDTTFNQQVIDKLVYGALGNLQLEIPLVYRADKTSKAYLPLITRIIADRMTIKDEVTSTSSEEDLVAFGIGTFATLDFSVRNPIDNKHAGIYFRMSYELLGTEGSAGERMNSLKTSPESSNLSKGIYHLAQFDCGFRGTNGVVIGFHAPVRLKNEEKFLASDKWRIGVRVEPGKW
ncbi:MAG: hypothetical protein AB8F78_06980 [Saprospiraceae bacterium]